MEVIKEAVKIIKEGGVILCPTDTVYGLVGDAMNKKAVAKIFKIKNRPKSKPLLIFVKDIKMAKKLAEIDKEQEKFLKSVWPGKATLVLRPKRKFPPGIGKPGKEIGLRIPSHKFLLRLAERVGPLAQTSANISGRLASTRIKEVLKQFENRKYQPDLIIDEGNLPKSKPSKIIDLTIWPPKILRS